MGGFIILNEQGWVATVAHLVGLAAQYGEDQAAYRKYEVELAKARVFKSPRERRRKIAALKPNPRWLMNFSHWWYGYKVVDIAVVVEADLAVGRIEEFNPATVPTYPILKDPKKMEQGTSLCRLGYAFNRVGTTYDEGKDAFTLANLEFPVFPNEGISTRFRNGGMSSDGKYTLRWIETSSPGLPGQSGGPIFDQYGYVWAIQSRTEHIPLGFRAEFELDGTRVVEHQVLNIGFGPSVEVLLQVLAERGVSVTVSPT